MNMAERKGFDYRRYLQVTMNPTLPREYPVFARVTSEFQSLATVSIVSLIASISE